MDSGNDRGAVGGRRKLSIIPTDAEGYSTRLLKSASNNGKNIFVFPLQEKLSTEPLSYDSVVFQDATIKMHHMWQSNAFATVAFACGVMQWRIKCKLHYIVSFFFL
ncbi:hypothetical protein ATANTOWER_026422 [Ataeniobius toweri]|uniref:Uncharacterized protein n=1 Tax=Ataeniobius toweri TaxID=208326 RepID=A0ABU7BRM7_9TELE|nr:hypothetical protein [Ataeniobius toweri]